MIIVDLSTQTLYAKDKEKTVLSSRISSGKRSTPTPTGIFSVQEKQRYHKSTLYPKPSGGARMNFMLRINGSIAIHSGYVPNYPDSHGCIRLPKSKARKLFSWADLSTTVKVVGSIKKYEPTVASNTGLYKGGKLIEDEDFDDFYEVEYVDQDEGIVEVFY